MCHTGYNKEDYADRSFITRMVNLGNHFENSLSGADIYNITNSDLSDEVTLTMDEVCHHYDITNIRLQDIDKQSGYPSVSGMKNIRKQVWQVITERRRG